MRYDILKVTLPRILSRQKRCPDVYDKTMKSKMLHKSFNISFKRIAYQFSHILFLERCNFLVTYT